MMQGVASSCGGLVHPMSPAGIAVQTQTQSQLQQQPQSPARAWSGLGAGVSGCSTGALQTSKTTTTTSQQRRLGSSCPSMVITGLGLPCAQKLSENGPRAQKMRSVVVRAAIQEQEQEKKEKEGNGKPKADAEETTRKLGLEAGLWQIFTSKEKTEAGTKVSKTSQAKDLLTRYGGAYLITSITLSLISFGLCYVLINNGVDVPSLLEKVGIQTNETGEKVGTFALAYAAHKAASPIRFPPTVALTPIVAGWFGKSQISEIVVVEEEKDGEEEKKP